MLNFWAVFLYGAGFLSYIGIYCFTLVYTVHFFLFSSVGKLNQKYREVTETNLFESVAATLHYPKKIKKASPIAKRDLLSIVHPERLDGSDQVQLDGPNIRFPLINGLKGITEDAFSQIESLL